MCSTRTSATSSPGSIRAGWRGSSSTGSRIERVLRLIQKWLRAGVIEDGEWSSTEEGTAQGASVSPLLANVYLHYVFDLWADQWRRRHARGDVILTRFADDYVAGFEHREDAERFLADLRDRFAEFGLELASGEDAADRVRAVCGRESSQARDRKPETFDFLGFTHICAKTQERAVQAQAGHEQEADAGQAEPGQDRDAATLASLDPRTGTLACQRPGRALPLLRGARQHQGVAGVPRSGHPALAQALRRRSQRSRMTWERMRRIADAMATPSPHPSSLAAPRALTPEPKAGAQCVRRARWDLRGGRPQRPSLPRFDRKRDSCAGGRRTRVPHKTLG